MTFISPTWITCRLEPRQKHYPLFSPSASSIQIIYSVIVRAFAAAVRGPGVGWGKMERSGRVASPEA